MAPTWTDRPLPIEHVPPSRRAAFAELEARMAVALVETGEQPIGNIAAHAGSYCPVRRWTPVEGGEGQIVGYHCVRCGATELAGPPDVDGMRKDWSGALVALRSAEAA